YWAVSGIFHLIDEWDLFPQYRLHTPAEVLKRNHVSRWDVLRDVVLQQIIQTAVGLGLTLIDPEPTFGKEEYDIAVWAQRLRIAQRAIPSVLAILGVDASSLANPMSSSHASLSSALLGGIYPTLTQPVLLHGQPVTVPAFASWELLAGRTIYHLLIPALQFITAICIVDTWQYFLHRAMHMNKYLYTTFHSRHHRLYVPYAYGALYNHPFEGFLLDTLGAGLAYLLTGMTCRQSMWFFTLSTIKTVDDHCGYAIPWDPLQHLTGNNAGYHDVHHQSWGIKTNFSQPFFTFWDRVLGTKWVGGDVSARYERAKIAAQRKADRDVQAITGSQAVESKQASTAKSYANDTAQATSAARSAHSVAEPRVPAGKATHQALGSRQQILDDRQSGGISVVAEETAEEVRAQQQQQKPRRSLRKRTTSSGLGLKGFADRVGESLHGKSSGVLGVDSKFNEGLKGIFEKASQGLGASPLELSTSLGPAVDQKQFERIMGLIEDGKKPASLVTGGSRKGDEGCFIEPTIFSEPANDSAIPREEIFGSVLCVKTFKTDGEVVALANDTIYGLSEPPYTLPSSPVLFVSFVNWKRRRCSSAIHVASDLSFSPDPNIVVSNPIPFTRGALHSAAKDKSIKHFVLTSSAAAASQLKFNEPYDLTPESWTTAQIKAAWAPLPYEQDRIMSVCAASKAQAEQAMWQFTKEHEPQFVANSGYGPSNGTLQALWHKNYFFKVLYPQFVIDIKDTAWLHVAALIAPYARNERIFAYAHNKTWTDWIARLKEMYPDHDFPDPPENEGFDMAYVTG
ncbi:hypothetical protein B0A55_12665, partial [Friedmanniomyces simplex]